jgi:hypothetical protein
MENILINPVLEKARKVTENVKSNIAGKTPGNLVHYANEPESVIRQRIEALDKEWDMARMLQLNASILTIAGVALGTRVNKNWFFLPGVVALFLGVHAVKGWSPPVPLLKAAGVRTRQDIDKEKYGLLEILKLRKRNSQL